MSPILRLRGVRTRVVLTLLAGVVACDNADVLNLQSPEPQLSTTAPQCFGRNATIYPGNPGAGSIVDNGGGLLTITGTSGNDIIVGGSEADVIDGLGGIDRICALEGDDQITGGSDPDQMDGGDGVDAILYTGSSAGVTITMATGKGAGGDADRDKFLNIENVTGSALADVIRGDAQANEIQGGGGVDNLRGGDGADILRGGVDDDVLQGENGDDSLFGDAGADQLMGGEDADALDGGTESDVASYVASSGGVQVDLGSVGAGAAAQGDTYTGIENLTGSAFDDELTGDTEINVLTGLGGVDVMRGGAGNDRLRGGEGADTLYGGTEDDFIQGDAGNDVIHGEDGADRLFGYDGDDLMFGGAGNDDLRPMEGVNTVDGGPDTDYLDTTSCTDIVTNVETYGTIRCRAASDPANATLTPNAASLVANGSDSTTITLQLRNADGTPLTLGSNSIVKMTTSAGWLWDGANTATLLRAIAGNNGKYTLVLGSSTNFETATITATVDGNPVGAVLNVPFLGLLDHFVVIDPSDASIPTSPSGTPFGIKIVALDVDQNPASFNGTVDLAYEGSASGSLGTSANFSAGVLTTMVSIPADGSYQIRATRTGGVETGLSNNFDVASPYIQLTPDSTYVVTGNNITLTAVVKNFDGTNAADQSVTWGTNDGAVATVDGSGVVTGVAVGFTSITVTQGPLSNSAQLGVCPNLAVGGVYTSVMPGAADLCFDGGASGQEYTYMPINLSTSSSLSLTLTGNGIQAVTGPPSPNVIADASSNVLGLQHDLVDDAMHFKILEENAKLSRTSVAPVRTAEKRSIAFGSGPAGSVQMNPGWTSTPTIGELWPVNVGSGCSGAPDTRTGMVRSIGNHIIIVSDTANPAGGFTTAQYDSIALEFDSIAYPVDTVNFGGPSDIDGNGKIVMFYTRAVNELSPPASSAITPGYFARRDLFPVGDCQQSNEGEILYMLVPDPTGSVNSNVRTVSLVRGQAILTAGHELQHLINSSRRMHVTASASFEESWLDEQLSNVAEELMFYRTSVGLTPRSNIVVSNLTTGPNASRRVAAYNTYANPNFGRLRGWLQRPDTAGSFKAGSPNSLALRGVGWAFLRYSADRTGGTESSFWASFIDSNLTGKDNIQNAIGADPNAWYRDFVTAMYSDDAVSGIAPEYTNPSWSYRSLFIALNGSYQLVPRPLTNATGLTLSYSYGGGTAFARFGVPAGGFARTTALSGGVPPTSPFALTVVRTK